MEKYIYAVDFDGTIMEHVFPDIGDPVPHAFETMKMLQEQGNLLILYTMRSGVYLDDAIKFCKERGIEFWAVNKNPEQYIWTSSPKVYAHFYIDDAMLGAPLIEVPGKRPYLNWLKIQEFLPGAQTNQHLVLPKDII